MDESVTYNKNNKNIEKENGPRIEHKVWATAWNKEGTI